jgi:hypothetical protein
MASREFGNNWTPQFSQVGRISSINGASRVLLDRLDDNDVRCVRQVIAAAHDVGIQRVDLGISLDDAMRTLGQCAYRTQRRRQLHLAADASPRGAGSAS